MGADSVAQIRKDGKSFNLIDFGGCMKAQYNTARQRAWLKSGIQLGTQAWNPAWIPGHTYVVL